MPRKEKETTSQMVRREMVGELRKIRKSWLDEMGPKIKAQLKIDKLKSKVKASTRKKKALITVSKKLKEMSKK